MRTILLLICLSLAASCLLLGSAGCSKRTTASGTESATTQQTGSSTAEAQPKKAVVYTCPMHPQVQQDKPGKCPICGMDLVVKN